MAQDALTRFSMALINEANDQKLELIKELQTQRTQRLEAAKDKMTKEAETRIAKAKAKLDHEKRLTLSTRETEMHQSLVQNRTRLMNEVFEAVLQNVRDYTKTPAYEAYLKQSLHEAAEYFRTGTGTKCTVMPQDAEKIQALCEAEGLRVTVQTASEDLVGGFQLENEELQLGLECTLRSRIEEEKQVFYETSGLIIE